MRSLAGPSVTYTAYDALGNAHQKRVPSDTASIASSAKTVVSARSNWAKPAKTTESKMVTPVTVTNPRGYYDSEGEDEM